MTKYKLKKADSYGLENSGENLIVKWSLGGKVFMKTLENGELKDEQTLRLCDEEVALYNGAKLLRFAGELIIETEDI